MQEISVQQLYEIFHSDETGNVILIDVRSKTEHSEISMPHSKCIPVDEITSHADELKSYDAVYVHCMYGGRSSNACKKLVNLGLTNVVNVNGGLDAWEREKMPMVHEE